MCVCLLYGGIDMKSNYVQKKILVIFTWWSMIDNDHSGNLSQKIKSDPNGFVNILRSSIDIVKQNREIEVDASIVELFNIDSSNMTPKNWTKIIEKIEESYDDFDGFVISHGTNTMWYTCAALSFALENINKPVIVTWAQIPLGYLGSDSLTNLVNALRLAVWGYHEIKWVMAVFGSKIITWTRVSKWTDFDYDPFSSSHIGSLWQIWRFMQINEWALNQHISYLSLKNPLAVKSDNLQIKKRFDVEDIVSLIEFPGMQADIFQFLVQKKGSRAFIFSAFGAWDPSSELFSAFEYLKEKKIPIVVTTQAENGVASFQVNEWWWYLRDNDLAIPAYDMSIESITTKLWRLLAQWIPYEDMKKSMLEDLHGEIHIKKNLI